VITWSITIMNSFLPFAICYTVHSACKLPLIEWSHSSILGTEFVWWVLTWSYFSIFTHLLADLIHSQHVSCLSMEMFVHTQDWVCVVNNMVHDNHIFSSFPFCWLWTAPLSVGMLPLNRHVDAHSGFNFMIYEHCDE